MAIAAEHGNEIASYMEHRYNKGRAEGGARAILAVLTARHIEVSEEDRKRIATCGDTEQLEKWIVGAITVTSVKDLFAL